MNILNINDRIFKGLHNGMDKFSYNLLVAKFFNQKTALDYLTKFVLADFKKEIIKKGIKVDVIVAIATRDSNTNIVKAVGKELAKAKNVPIYQLDKDQKIGVVLDRFLQRNPGINILLIDDVIYTGKTANLALKNLSKYKQVGKISFYPFAKSKSY